MAYALVTTEKAKVEAMQAAAASAAPLEEAGVTVAVKAVAAEAKARVAKVLVVLEGAVRPAAAAIQAAFRPVPTFRHHQPCMQRSMRLCLWIWVREAARVQQFELKSMPSSLASAHGAYHSAYCTEPSPHDT